MEKGAALFSLSGVGLEKGAAPFPFSGAGFSFSGAGLEKGAAPFREILVDRSDTHGYGLLTIDTTPNYHDTQPWPTAKTIWTYKAIYRADDAQVGHWSQPVSVTVSG